MLKKILIVCLMLASVGCVIKDPYGPRGRSYPGAQKARSWVRNPQGCTETEIDGMVEKRCVASGAEWARAWVRKPHGMYLCFVSGSDPHITKGRKLAVTNKVCDPGAPWNATGECVDETGDELYDTWVGMTLNSNRVVVLEPAFIPMDDPGYCLENPYDPACQAAWQPASHPSVEGETLLGPQATCFLETGASKIADIKVRFYHNMGSDHDLMFSSESYKSYTERFPLTRWVYPYQIDQSRRSMDYTSR